MQRSNVAVFVLALLAALLGASSVMLGPVWAHGVSGNRGTDRPGDAAYAPTKLEWVALELQATYGTTWTSENPVAVAFSPLNDGKTVLCLLQYTPAVSAGTLQTSRAVEQTVFERYVQKRGWFWLRLQFQEQMLPRPSH